jgi:transcriptional regulator with XRE-family HTH domain
LKGVIHLKSPTTFGARFKELREEKGLTLEQVGKELGFIKQTISKYEKNENEPAYSDLVRIAKFFEVSIDYLLGRTDERQ